MPDALCASLPWRNARDMNRLIPGSKLVIYPESGHMTFVDQPELFLKSVDEFLHAAR